MLSRSRIFFQPGRAGKTLGGMDDLRKALLRAQSRVQIWPPVAASSVTVTMIGTSVSRPVGSGPPIRRVGCASHQPGRLKRFLDLADIDDGPPSAETLGKPPPGGDRQPAPFLTAPAGRGSENRRGAFAGRCWRMKPCDLCANAM